MVRQRNQGDDQGLKEELERLFTKAQREQAWNELRRIGVVNPTYRDVRNRLTVTGAEQIGAPAADAQGFRGSRAEQNWREGKFGGDPNNR